MCVTKTSSSINSSQPMPLHAKSMMSATYSSGAAIAKNIMRPYERLSASPLTSARRSLSYMARYRWRVRVSWLLVRVHRAAISLSSLQPRPKKPPFIASLTVSQS